MRAEQEVKPHKVRYYLERRDPAFEAKMAEVLCVYQEVALLRAAETNAAKTAPPDLIRGRARACSGAMNKTEPTVEFGSYDEKPGIQAISNTAPDLPPVAGEHACIARDHEYKRLGTLSLLAGIDLLTGQVHACVEDRHRSREFVGFLKKLDTAYPSDTAIKIILDNHSAHVSREINKWLAAQRDCRFTFVFTPKTWFLAQLGRRILSEDGALSPVSHPHRLKSRTEAEASPTSTTSIVSLLSTLGLTGSPSRRDMSRFMETLY